MRMTGMIAGRLAAARDPAIVVVSCLTRMACFSFVTQRNQEGSDELPVKRGDRGSSPPEDRGRALARQLR